MKSSTKLLSWLQSGKRSVDQEEKVSSTRTEEDKSEPSTGANSGFDSAGDVPGTSASSSKRYKTVRNYDSNYIKFGFICSGRVNEPRPQCVLCGKVLSNECMKPSHLKRHLTTKHMALKDKPVGFFYENVMN